MRAYQRILVFALVVAVVVGCNRASTATTSSGGVMASSVTVANGPEDDGTGPVPFRLSEGEEQPADVPPLPLAETTPLAPAQVQQILDRLPPIQVETGDTQDYALPAASLPPPLTGEIIEQPFPPPAGTTGPEEISAGPLEVLRFSPEGDVPLVPNLSVTFSQPMVPLTSHEELAAEDVPVILTPDIPGHWRWVGTRTLFFEADVTGMDRFPMATEYTAEVPAGTQSATGATLAQSVRWTFTTPPPQLQNSYPTGGPYRLDPLLFAAFDQRIEPAAVLETVRATAQGGTHPVRLATEDEVAADPVVSRLAAQAGEGRWLAFLSDTRFPADTTVTVNIGPGTPSAEGPRTTEQAQSFTFQTYGPLRVVEHFCSWGGDRCPPFTPWTIRFSNPIDAAQFEPSLVQVAPELPGMKVEVYGNILSIRGNTKGRTTYNVTLSPEIADQFGQTLGQEVTLRFTVGPADPYLTATGGPLVVQDPSARPSYAVYTVNIPQLRVQVYAVQPEDYPSYLEYLGQSGRTDPPSPPGKQVYADTLRVNAADDELVETAIDLGPALAGEYGHLIVIVEPEANLLSSLFGRGRVDYRVITWVQVTQIGLDAFVDNEAVLVWTNELQSGAPLYDVAVSLWPDGGVVRSDDGGTATLRLSNSDATLLLARQGEDSAFWPASRYYYSRDSGWKRTPASDSLRWYVFDDRQMYRPGEEVHVKGWIRSLGGGVSGDVGLLPSGAANRVRYRVVDPLGNQVAGDTVDLNRLGGFDLAFGLPENINLGYVALELEVTGGSVSGDNARTTHWFQVQEFRRPEFQVSATASEGPHFVGGHAIATVDASYYAGGPLANAEVTWQVSASPGSYSPPNWPDFTFGAWVPWWRSNYAPSETHSDTFQGRTDASGAHHLRIDFDPADPPRPRSIQAQATVMDVNRQAWTAGAALLVHPAQLYVGLRSERYFVDLGTPLHIDAVVTDLDGKPVAGRPITVTAARLDWTFLQGSWQEEVEDLQECTLTSESEPVRCTFETPAGGTYRITATVADDEGHRNQSEFTRWVSGGQRPPSREVEQEEVQLIPNAMIYQPGDRAEILVQAPFYPAEGVLTLRRSGLVSSERFTMDGPTYTLEVPIEERFIPNVTVQVDLVGSAPRLDDAGEEDTSLPKRPAYAMGNLNLAVSPLSRTLAVAVAPQDEKLSPGGETAIAVTVTDAGGAPVEGAELAVVVVDEAVLALSDYQLADPVTVFYSLRSPGVSDFHNRSDILLSSPEMLAPEAEVMALEADGAAPAPTMARSAMPAAEQPDMEEAGEMAAADEATGAQQPGIQVRTNFDALALFAPEVATGDDGRAEVTVTLPDNLTRYRVMVVAVAGGKHFGSGESAITARLPLMVRPSAPRFLNFGDRFELPIVVQNQTDAAMSVDVAVRASNAQLAQAGEDAEQNAAGQRVTVPANDRVEVRFPTTTDRAGTARFQVVAVTVDAADAAEISLPVWTPATTEAFAVYGEVDEGAVVQPVRPPAEVIPSYGGLEIGLSSTALQALTDAFLYLVAYPFECSEQLASRILAVAALRDVLAAFDAQGLPAPDEVVAAVERDIQRLQQMQNYDGGFPIWQRGYDSWPYHSIHAAHALQRAKAKGFDVPPEMLSRSQDYLRNVESHIPSWYGQKARHSLVSYALYVRKLLGDVDTPRARQLVDQVGLENLSLESVGWLLYVLTDDPSSASQVEAIRRHLNNRVTETAGAANFVDSYADGDYLLLYSNRRSDGVILEALIADQPESDLIPKLVRGLLGHRTQGRWGNTQENVFILLAMDRYFHAYEAQTPDFVARVWLGEQYAGSHEFRGRTTEQAQIDIPMTYVLSSTQASRNQEQVPLVVEKEGEGRLYYRLGLRYAPTDLVLDPADHGFTVERRYEAVDDDEDVYQDDEGVWHVRAGARVRVRVTMVAPSRRYHVALVDPLPAGLEALNPALAVVGDLPQDPGSQSERQQAALGQRSGWWWWGPWYEHQNLRDERAEAFASLVWAGVHEYTYIARATTPGVFVVPPAKAEEMYAPEVFGRSGTARMVVE